MGPPPRRWSFRSRRSFRRCLRGAGLAAGGPGEHTVVRGDGRGISEGGLLSSFRVLDGGEGSLDRGVRVVLVEDEARLELPGCRRVSEGEIREAEKAEKAANQIKGTMLKRFDFLDLE